jgi:uncharacterized protein YdeI (YjbR/CyaY-like superfamily)
LYIRGDVVDHKPFMRSTMELLHATTREEWRAWLEANHATRREIWLVFAKKHTGEPRITYNDAVEEALCFGWIDSIARKVDDDRFAQRFSVRRPKSPYSQPNIERLRHLAAAGKLLPAVHDSVRELLAREFVIPDDILEAIRANPDAWRNFQTLSPPYIRIRIAWIDGARKRPAEFRKRLEHFIRMTSRGRLIGFGGIEHHY